MGVEEGCEAQKELKKQRWSADGKEDVQGMTDCCGCYRGSEETTG